MGHNGTRVKGAVKLRAAVPAGSVFLAEGVVDEPANVLTEPLVEVQRVAGPAPTDASAVPAQVAPAAEGLSEMPPSAPLPIPPLEAHVIPVAEVGFYEDWWIQLLKALVIFAVVFQLVPIVLLAERKALGRFQHRYGPNRVGPFGMLQPMADIGKLIFKQQFRPRTATGWLFAIAPAISMLRPSQRSRSSRSPNVVDIFGTEVGLYGIDPTSGSCTRSRSARSRSTA